MKRPHHLPASRCLRGFSLIELMVAMAIGLIIAAASFSAYLGAAGASRIAEAQSRMNEDAQAALSLLTQQLRMAGSNPNQPGRTDALRRNLVYGLNDPATTYPSAFSLRGCGKDNSGTKSFSNLATATNIDGLKCEADSSALSDSITVSYEADLFNTVARPVTSTTPVKLPTDCLGAALANAGTLAEPYYVASNLFFIGGSSLRPSLYCKGNGFNEDGAVSTAKPLVENIEGMQLGYGTAKALTAASDVASAVVAGYLTTDEVLTEASMANLANDAERWAKVITVRICVLVRSEARVAPNSASAQYLNCDGKTELTPPDLRLRRAYTATVVLRNRRFSS